MKRRLGPALLLLLAAPALWLWRGGLGWFPVERELVWRLPAEGARVREVEIQLWSDADLLKRESRHFGPELPAPAALVQRLPLKEGVYLARIFLTRDDAERPSVLAKVLTVGSAEVVVTEL